MDGSLKVLLFMVIVLSYVFNSQARNRRDKPNVYKAFKNCKTAVCASRVSFCIIMEDCGCGAEAGDVCKCCEDCYRCLGAHLWIHCCDCVGLCGKISLNNTDNGVEIPSKSGDLPGQPLPSLFEAMSHGSHFPIAFITRPFKGGALKNGKSVASSDRALLGLISFHLMTRFQERTSTVTVCKLFNKLNR